MGKEHRMTTAAKTADAKNTHLYTVETLQFGTLLFEAESIAAAVYWAKNAHQVLDRASVRQLTETEPTKKRGQS